MKIKKITQSESALQQQCLKWFAFQYPKLAEQGLLFSIPNGANKSIAQAMKFKREGLVSGIPDLMLAVPKGIYHGLFIEMKAAKGKPSANQIKMIGKLRDQYYYVDIINSFEQFTSLINKYLAQ